MKRTLIFVSTIFLCLSCFAFGHVLPSKPVPSNKLYICAEEPSEEITVSITGFASKTLLPDCASIFACLKSENESMLGRGQTSAYQDLLTKLYDCGVQENQVRLNSSSCYPSRWIIGDEVDTYNCCYNFTVKVSNIDNLSCVVDTLNDSGAEILNLSYCIANIEEEYSSIIDSAIEDSKSKAGKVLSEGEYKFVDVKEKSVFYNSNISVNMQDSSQAEIEISGRVESIFQQKKQSQELSL